MEFGISEYTLVFRRGRGSGVGELTTHNGWMVVRPTLVGGLTLSRAERARSSDIAEMFVVPVCSTLALDSLAYERFLSQSGVLEGALLSLGRMRLNGPRSVENTRKRIQSLVMAAEVQFIVQGMIA